MVNGGWRILFGIAIILVVLWFFIKHSGDEKKTQKSDISLTKIIIKNYKSLSLYDSAVFFWCCRCLFSDHNFAEYHQANFKTIRC